MQLLSIIPREEDAPQSDFSPPASRSNPLSIIPREPDTQPSAEAEPEPQPTQQRSKSFSVVPELDDLLPEVLSDEEMQPRSTHGLSLVPKTAPVDSPSTESSEDAAPSVTLFAYGSDPGPRPTSFIASMVLHIIGAAIVSFSVAYKPPIIERDTNHYAVRKLDLQTPIPPRHAPAVTARAIPHHGITKPSKSNNSQQSAAQQIAEVTPGPQTLIQPDLPQHTTLAEEVPVPQAMVWTPSNNQPKNVTPPRPSRPTGAAATPSVDKPNDETNLAEVNLASGISPLTRMHLQPGTTSPLAVPAVQQLQLPPSSMAQSSAQPTPASILSISDLIMKNGTVVLPPVNETRASDTRGNAAAGKGQGWSLSSMNTFGDASPSGTSDYGLDSTGMPPTTPIVLPKDGRFGAVVIGNALGDLYPEANRIWAGRMAYTAYLHVGLAKSWLLQYALPRSADAAAAGSVARLEAPWPYNIVRPNLDPGSINADALLIHGFVDASGHFQSLNFVFPKDYAGAQFVLSALNQWQFRPAAQEGQTKPVEIVLIIPEGME